LYVRIDLDNVLWRTRGLGWDYTFVLRPAHPHLNNWYDVHADVFSGTSPGATASNLGGVLHTADNQEVVFVPASFLDPGLKDSAARPIAHYLVWFPPVVGLRGELAVPPDWAIRVVEAFGDAWRDAFAGDGVSDADLLASARALIKEVVVADTATVPVSLARRVFEKKNFRSPDVPGKRNLLRLLAATAAVCLLALLIYWLLRP
jgi:hypothetical protein